MRRVSALMLWAGALVGVIAGCSTGGGGAGDIGANTQPANNRVLCSLIAQLPDSAALLQRVDVRDPTEFNRVLNEAVQKYTTTLDDIAPRVDGQLKTTVAEVRRLVAARKFSAAGEARVPLDTWTADHC